MSGGRRFLPVSPETVHRFDRDVRFRATDRGFAVESEPRASTCPISLYSRSSVLVTIPRFSRTGPPRLARAEAIAPRGDAPSAPAPSTRHTNPLPRCPTSSPPLRSAVRPRATAASRPSTRRSPGENVPDRSSARRWSALAPLLALAIVAAFAVAAFAGSPLFGRAPRRRAVHREGAVRGGRARDDGDVPEPERGRGLRRVAARRRQRRVRVRAATRATRRTRARSSTSTRTARTAATAASGASATRGAGSAGSSQGDAGQAWMARVHPEGPRAQLVPALRLRTLRRGRVRGCRVHRAVLVDEKRRRDARELSPREAEGSGCTTTRRKNRCCIRAEFPPRGKKRSSGRPRRGVQPGDMGDSLEQMYEGNQQSN